MPSSAAARPRGLRLAGVYAGYAAVFLVFVGPVLWMVLASVKRNIDITASNPVWLFTPTIEHYIGLFERFRFGRYILNSFLIAGASTVIGVAAGSCASFVIARRRTRGLAFALLVSRMAPGVMFVIPLYVLSVRLGAANNVVINYSLLIAAHLIITLPLAVWLTLPFFEAIPTDIDEAARVDGCSLGTLFRRVHLPLASQGIAVAGILCFIFSWNYFLFALVLSNTDTLPLPVIAFSFIGQGQANWGGLMAASTVLMLPAFVIATVGQRRLVAGMTSGAVK